MKKITYFSLTGVFVAACLGLVSEASYGYSRLPGTVLNWEYRGAGGAIDYEDATAEEVKNAIQRGQVPLDVKELCYAAQAGNYAAVDILLKCGVPANGEMVNDYEQNNKRVPSGLPLYALCDARDLTDQKAFAVAKRLLQGGAKINGVLKMNSNFIYRVISNEQGWTQTLELLLKNGANPNYGFFSNYITLPQLKLLLKYKGNPRTTGALMQATKSGPDTLEYMLKTAAKADINKKIQTGSSYYDTPLTKVVEYGDAYYKDPNKVVKVVDMLLRAGANPRIKSTQQGREIDVLQLLNDNSGIPEQQKQQIRKMLFTKIMK
jgi:hypothetical protein